VPSGDLALTKAVDKSVAEFGDTLTYSVNVAASGNSDQTNVVVTDSVPDKTTYVDGSAACDAPCTASESGGVVTWHVGSLATGASTVVTFQVTIDTPAGDAAGAIPEEFIRNVALGSSDLDPGVESNRVTTTITAVLGEQHHRKPTHHVKGEHDQLPFTGLPLLRLLLMAAGAVGLGAWLVARTRSRRAFAGQVPPSED